MRNLTYSILILFSLYSCTSFEAPTFNSDLVGFKSDLQASYTYFALPDDAPQSSGISVNLFGAPKEQEVAYSFEIDANSTAKEGIHYNITGPAIISASQNSEELPIEILAHNFEDAEPYSLIIKLTQNFIEGFEERTFQLIKLCPSEINTSISYTATIEVHPGFGPDPTTNPEVFLTKIGDSRYNISDVTARFMEALCCPACIAENVIVEDICNQLIIRDPNPDGNNCWSWVSPAPGSYEVDTGDLLLPVLESGGGLSMVIRLTPN